ncbi:hypothetical protein GM3708_1929 [Geminocystis sp. NIES-3708]|uniref:hypothetical protein n=1 Tax=Geminocystis sp. NIES-3708 TaxID=1615909 RepID=UPI0005FCA4C9|nr:hypothetical protein [Geminocystis sp. NIES-3708]BAQ61523.1 hypothetical protein GM3708_1929 [Geminocystis sp. NIES-3708]
MNKKTAHKITSAASFLITSDALKCRKYLEPCLRLSLDILEVLRNSEYKHYTSRQISQYLEENSQTYREKGLNANTVCQVLQALKRGGIDLSSNSKLGWTFQLKEK